MREIPGEPIPLEVDPSEYWGPIVFLGFPWLAFVALGLGPLSTGLYAVLVAGVLLGYRRTLGTIFTTEGVWRPGLLDGGRFLRWRDVERVTTLGRRGVTHIVLHTRQGRVPIHMGFRDPFALSRVIRGNVCAAGAEVLPLEGEV